MENIHHMQAEPFTRIEHKCLITVNSVVLMTLTKDYYFC